MKVLVTGGTGFVGRHLCEELDDRGHDVTALSRSPDDEVLPDGVAAVAGDVTEYDAIEGAFAGQDAVVNLVALSPLYEPTGGNDRHFEVHLGGTENCVAAAEEHGVSRFLQMSALGADRQGETAYIRSKGQAEDAVERSELDWTIVRPSVLFGEGGEFVSFTKRLKGMFAPKLPIYPLPGGGKTRFQPIWIGNLVSMLADAATNPEHVGETYELGGPEVLTLREITNMVYESEGKSVSIVPIPMALAGVGLKTMGMMPGFPMGGDQYRSLRFDNTVEDSDVAAFGVDPENLRTLGSYLGVTLDG
jgi:NADH dehydrogenase